MSPSDRGRSTRRWLALLRVSLLAAPLVVGCGVRTSPLVEGAPPRDAGPADAPFDLGVDLGVDLGADMTIARIACEADRDCAGDTVCRATSSLMPTDLAPVPLFCERRQLVDGADGAACGGTDSAGCERGLCVIAGTCVVPCATVDDCHDGERCAQVYVRTGVGELQPVRACTPMIDAPPSVRSWLDRGIAATPGGFAPVEVLLGHAARTTVALVSAQSGADVYLQALRDRDGLPMFDLGALGPGLPAQVNPVNPAAVALTVLLPSGSDLPLGDYRGEFVTDARAVLDRIVLDRDDTGRALDLDLYFVAGRLMGPRGALITPELARAIELFRAFYADVGIVLGEVRTHELVGGLARGYATLEMDADGRIPETDTLFALTAGAQGPSVSWFFVRDAEGVLGVSGGVPGAQCMPGTAASGIAFSSDIMGTGVPLESVLIHETGHFLGLFHTSELDGTLLDPFDDTPSCGPDRDANGDGMLLPDECVGAGADNVMFWAAMDARTFSPSQRALVQRALLLR